MDKAWYNNTVQPFLKKNGIHLYSTFSKKKAFLVELKIKQLKQMLYKHMTKTKTKNWLNVLPQVTRSMNNSYSNPIGMAPSAVNEKNQGQVWSRVYHSIVDMDQPVPKYSPGQLVRLSKTKAIFDKAYTQGYTDEIFKIHSVLLSRPVVSYKISDLQGNILQLSAYEEELVPVASTKNDDK